MVKLKNIPGLSALHHIDNHSAPKPQGSNGITIIRDTGLIDKINLRTAPNNEDAHQIVQNIVGTTLPTEANSFKQIGQRTIIWLAPDEWMILAENGAVESIIVAFDTPKSGHIAAVDVSDAFGGITLKGPHTRDALAKHCAIDLHPQAFEQGQAAQSLLGMAAITLLCLDHDRFLVIGRTSFMPYILDLITDASIEYGYDYQTA